MRKLNLVLGLVAVVVSLALLSIAGAATVSAQPPEPTAVPPEPEPTLVPPEPIKTAVPGPQPGPQPEPTVVGPGDPFPSTRPPVTGRPRPGTDVFLGDPELAGILLQLDQSVLDRTADAVMRYGRIRMSLNDVLRAVRLAGCVECERALQLIVAATDEIADHQGNRNDPLYLGSIRDRLVALRLAQGEPVTQAAVADWIRNLLRRFGTTDLGPIALFPDIPFPSTQPPLFYDLVRMLPRVDVAVVNRIEQLLATTAEHHPEFLADGGLTLDEIRVIVADSDCVECQVVLDAVIAAMRLLAVAQATPGSDLVVDDEVMRRALLDLVAGRPVPLPEVVRWFDGLRLMLERMLLPSPSPAAR